VSISKKKKPEPIEPGTWGMGEDVRRGWAWGIEEKEKSPKPTRNLAGRVSHPDLAVQSFEGHLLN